MKSHAERIKNSGVKSDHFHRCQICDKAFIRKYTLERHKITCKSKFEETSKKILIAKYQKIAYCHKNQQNPNFEITDVQLDDCRQSENGKYIYKELSEESKKLVTLLKSADCIINFARQRGKTPLFCEIQKAIEERSHLRFDKQAVEKILGVSPEIYQVKWMAKDKQFFLAIDFPNSLDKTLLETNKIKERKMNFIKRLLEAQTNESEIRPAKLPEQPKQIEPKPSIISFINELKKKKNQEYEILNTIELTDVKEENLVKGVDSKLALMIKKKQVKKSFAKTVLMTPDQIFKEKKAENLFSICIQLKYIYYTTDRPSIFVKTLVKKIRENNKFSTNKEEIKDYLNDITGLFSEWFFKISTPSGDVIRINKNCAYNEVDIKSRIDNFL